MSIIIKKNQYLKYYGKLNLVLNGIGTYSYIKYIILKILIIMISMNINDRVHVAYMIRKN